MDVKPRAERETPAAPSVKSASEQVSRLILQWLDCEKAAELLMAVNALRDADVRAAAPDRAVQSKGVMSPETNHDVQSLRAGSLRAMPDNDCAAMTGVTHPATNTSQAPDRAVSTQRLDNLLCNVANIFNGWRGDEAWTEWDESIAFELSAVRALLGASPSQQGDEQ